MTPAPETSIAVLREGTGPEVLLVHGGASPATTWVGLEPLARRFTLAYVYRRGYPPSPPPEDGRQNYELDATDLLGLLADRPHLVAHSYGGVAAAIAAVRQPALVRSLTLLEPALFLPADDPEVARFGRMGDEVLAHGLEASSATLREFLRISGAPVPDKGPLPEQVARGVLRAPGSSTAHPGPAEARGPTGGRHPLTGGLGRPPPGD